MTIWISGFSYLYYVVTYIAFEFVYSMILIPYDTLAAEMTSNLMATMYLFQIIGVAIAAYFTIKLSPGGAFRIVSLIFMASIAGFLIVYGTIPNSLIALYFVSGLAGLGRGGINFVPWNNYTFVPDVDEIVSADRREGVFAGFMSLLRKASQALAVFLVGVILQSFHFTSGSQTQPQEALTAMAVILIAVPAMLLVFGIVSSFKFKVTHESHEILKKEVSRLKDGGFKEDADQETREVVEELTGLKYDQVWGNNKIGYRNWRRFKENQSP